MPYAKYKTTILKWRENNKEAWNEYQKNYNKIEYDKNPEKKRQIRMNCYYYKKECNRMRNILLLDI